MTPSWHRLLRGDLPPADAPADRRSRRGCDPAAPAPRRGDHRRRHQRLPAALAGSRVVAIIILPLSLLNVIVTLSASTSIDSTTSTTTFGGTSFNTTNQTTFNHRDFWTFLAGIVVVGLLSWLGTQLATAACFDIVSGTYLDTGADVARLAREGVVATPLVDLAAARLRLPARPRDDPVRHPRHLLLRGMGDRGACPPVRGPARAARRSSDRALLKGRWWPTAACWCCVPAQRRAQHVDPRRAARRRVVDDNELVERSPARSQARSQHPHHAVRSRGDHRHLLRRARAQGGLRPPADGASASASTPATCPSSTASRRSTGPPTSPSDDRPPFWPPPPGWKPQDG